MTALARNPGLGLSGQVVGELAFRGGQARTGEHEQPVVEEAEGGAAVNRLVHIAGGLVDRVRGKRGEREC